jgi:hypothetical protein
MPATLKRAVGGSTFLLALCLSVCGFAQPSSAQVFFDSSQAYHQAIRLMSETEVIVESSMPQEKVEVQRGTDGQVILSIVGRFSIAGYHGSRADAGAHAITGSDVAFRVSRTPDTLTLSSPEWTYIHHALLIDRLTIALPDAMAITFRRISSDELEGRR